MTSSGSLSDVDFVGQVDAWHAEWRIQDPHTTLANTSISLVLVSPGPVQVLMTSGDIVPFMNYSSAWPTGHPQHGSVYRVEVLAANTVRYPQRMPVVHCD